jgi:hypothetical protein
MHEQGNANVRKSDKARPWRLSGSAARSDGRPRRVRPAKGRKHLRRHGFLWMLEDEKDNVIT